jgi:hypothetical protein
MNDYEFPITVYEETLCHDMQFCLIQEKEKLVEMEKLS